MIETRDLYAVLEVDPYADDATLRDAYRRLARLHHPDVPGGSTQRMAELNEAWTILRDTRRRRRYDAERPMPEPPRIAYETRPADRAPTPAPQGPRFGSLLTFGRYEGWSIDQVARVDPTYLEWLGHAPIGRPFQAEIERTLEQSRSRSDPRPADRRRRFGGGRCRTRT